MRAVIFQEGIHMKKKFMAMIGCSLILLLVPCCTTTRRGYGSLRLVGYFPSAGMAYGIQIANEYAYITNNDGIVVFDIQNPAKPRQVSAVETGVAFGISIHNDRAYALGDLG